MSEYINTIVNAGVNGIYGVPDQFDLKSQVSEQFNVVKGNLNKFRLRPQIQNEHCESSRESMDVVDAATVVGQMFKASQGNINGISLTLQSAATFASMDAITVNTASSEQKAGTMEYSSDAELQEEWIKSGAVEAVRSAFTDDAAVTQDGNFAIKVPLTTLADEWRVALTSTDLSGVTFSVKFAQTVTFAQAQVYFFIGDGTNTKSFPMTVGGANLWQTFQFAETSMSVETTDDTVTTPSMAAITRMGFRIDNPIGGGRFAYADSITYQAEPGSVDIELWDMGTSLPASDGTIDYTTGTQYVEIGDRGIGGNVVATYRLVVIGGKRKYHIDKFIAGVADEIPANTKLTVGNYYALVLKYVDTDITLFGPNTAYSTNYYTNGYAWKAEVADDLIDIIPGAAGAGAYSDLMFQIFSTQKVYITGVTLLTENAPNGNADVAIFIEDENMVITSIAATVQKGGMGRTEIIYDLTLKPPILDIGGKIEAYYNDDPSDSVTKLLFVIDYVAKSPTING